MIISKSHNHLLIINAVEDYDPDFSRISIEIKPARVMLKYIAISSGYQGEGYCRKILTTFFCMCLEHGLSICVDKACVPVEHIFDSLVRDCTQIDTYIKIHSTEKWFGPNLEISFKKNHI